MSSRKWKNFLIIPLAGGAPLLIARAIRKRGQGHTVLPIRTDSRSIARSSYT